MTTINIAIRELASGKTEMRCSQNWYAATSDKEQDVSNAIADLLRQVARELAKEDGRVRHFALKTSAPRAEQ